MDLSNPGLKEMIQEMKAGISNNSGFETPLAANNN